MILRPLINTRQMHEVDLYMSIYDFFFWVCFMLSENLYWYLADNMLSVKQRLSGVMYLWHVQFFHNKCLTAFFSESVIHKKKI